jgi:lysine-N-methylase
MPNCGKGEACLQPAFYGSFQCIGAACEDNCCTGWGVSVDKPTYEKYQNNPGGGELGTRLKQLVTIQNPDNAAAYASIQLIGGRCPFLADSLCSIQQQLGKDYLGHACAAYPRILNTFDGQQERSLDLSCPEAAQRPGSGSWCWTFCRTGALRFWNA